MESLKKLIIPLWLLAISASGCIPVFKNPLPEPENLEPDTRILGNWTYKNREGDIQLSVFPRSSGWVDLVYIVQRESNDQGIDVCVLEGYSTSIGKNDFLCFRGRPLETSDANDVPEDHPYMLAYYKVTRKSFCVWLFTDSKIKSLIMSGELEGKINRRRNFYGIDIENITITASSDELASVISEKGPEAFVEDEETYLFSRAKR